MLYRNATEVRSYSIKINHYLNQLIAFKEKYISVAMCVIALQVCAICALATSGPVIKKWCRKYIYSVTKHSKQADSQVILPIGGLISHTK